jgi:Domain of unknown function (DUF1998)
MGTRQIRTSQLITPFGPGSIYTDSRGVPLIISGLDGWYQRLDASADDTLKANEFDIFEPRISEQIGINLFRRPADFRLGYGRRSEGPPQANTLVYTPAYRFPTWYQNTNGSLFKLNPCTRKIDQSLSGRLRAVRFVAVCSHGHLSEFPWKEWIECHCPDESGLRLIDGGGSDLGSVRVLCGTCPKGSQGSQGRTLSRTTKLPSSEPNEQGHLERSAFQERGISCPGTKPWLGTLATPDTCDQPLVAALINQVNLYYGKVISAISLPSSTDKNLDDLCAALKQERNFGTKKVEWRSGDQDEVIDAFVQRFKKRGQEIAGSDMRNALEILYENKRQNPYVRSSKPVTSESPDLAFRRAEFDVLRSENVDAAELLVRDAGIPAGMGMLLGRVRLIERLKETRVFCGFTRLSPPISITDGMPQSAIRQLYAVQPEDPKLCWLPANVVYGEGIYLELNEASIAQWLEQNKAWIEARYDIGFIARLAAIPQTNPPNSAPTLKWTARFMLVHTFAHLLLSQLVFDCGYSTSALRERLYISADSDAPMAGILIYTAAGDSEGTLGGLVKLGRPEFLRTVIERALRKAMWCSADPVCSENMGGQGTKKVNMAACHSCSLLPETSCESFNLGLDRAAVVGTPVEPALGWAAQWLQT